MIEGDLKGFKKVFDEELSIFFSQKREEYSQYEKSQDFCHLVDVAEDFVLRGGKRLRPFLFCYGYELFGRKGFGKDIVKVSIVMELLHAYLLIHDDIIDEDDTRHGGSSVHHFYEKTVDSHLNREGAEHFGVSMAINLGDLLSMWIYEIIDNSSLDSEDKNKISKKIFKIGEETLLGQVLDLQTENEESPSFDDIMRIYEFKTAKYTFSGPIQSGAIISGADQHFLDLVNDFSIPLGVAYQIQDDILGMFGSEEKTGKPIGSDFREGKNTLLIYFTMKNSSKEDLDFIYENFGSENVSDEDVEKARKIMIDSGALEENKKVIEDMHNKFLKEISGTEFIDKKNKKYLVELSNYLINREY